MNAQSSGGWQREWQRLSALIAGILEAGHFLVSGRAAGADSHHADSTRLLLNRIAAALELLRQFWERHQTQIPSGGRTVLGSYLSVPLPRTDGGAGFTSLVEGITSLTALRAEFEYAIADTESIARSLVARAFLHLQRSIIADETVRERWKRAFDSGGETRCEALGAVHLLQHGVWAFKASTTGEQTDLVLGEPLNNSDAQRAAVALVLTEWKLVQGQSEVEAKITEAQRQARRYAGSALAGFEVTSRRYLVLVSARRFESSSRRVRGRHRVRACWDRSRSRDALAREP